MTVMRRGIEAAFDQLEKIEPRRLQAPARTLVQALDNVAERLHGVEQSPILRQGAQHYAGVLERSGEALVGTPRSSSNDRLPTLNARVVIFQHASGARVRDNQNKWVFGAVGFGIITGVPQCYLCHVYCRTVDMAVASVVMNNDRWKAGIALMGIGKSRGGVALSKRVNLYKPTGRRLMCAPGQLSTQRKIRGVRLPCQRLHSEQQLASGRPALVTGGQRTAGGRLEAMRL